MSHPLFDAHSETLEKAIAANRQRDYHSAYPEIPSGKIYGETARDDGNAAYEALLNTPFPLDQPAINGTVGNELSPYGPSLGITYPKPIINELIDASSTAFDTWKRTDIETRVGICLEILKRLNARSFEMALAVMHTTGQGWMMAFQAGGPHAQDRGLEAVAYAYEEMTRVPKKTTWTKRVGRDETVTLDKRFNIVPRGISLAIGCSTFPTWNTYPGMFASLATGNTVIIKPHPNATLPLAITVQIVREVLSEQGIDPNVVLLAADSASDPIAKQLIAREEIAIIDYTGGNDFGEWIEANATHAELFTEKAGVNSIILDSCEDLRAVTGNLAFSLSLYSGQMCTTSQNIFIPKDGIKVGGQQVTFDDVAAAIVKAVDWFLGEPARATEVLGAINSVNTLTRIAQAASEGGKVMRESEIIVNEKFPEANVRGPLVIQVDASDDGLFKREMFGPIVYLIKTENTDQSIKIAAETSRDKGAITCAIYSTDQATLDAAEQATIDAGVPLSCNLTGSIWVNQSAAFSDFHVSGANPAGNATLTDSAFVSRRFNIVQTRIPVSA